MNSQIGVIKDAVPNIDSQIRLTESNRLASYDSLIKKLFYACEYCDGALIQLANCIVCRRAIIRKCTQCSTELTISHPMCVIPIKFVGFNNGSSLEMKDQ